MVDRRTAPHGPKTDGTNGPNSLRLWSLLRSSLSSYRQLGLSTQFLLAGAGVVCAAMAVLGSWVSSEISSTTLESAAMASAVHMETFIEPHVQHLTDDGRLTDETIEELERSLVRPALGRQLVSVKIWRRDGTVIYSSDRRLIGQRFDVEDVARAASGEIFAFFDKLEHPESELERAHELPLIEVYAPLHSTSSGEIIAVGEYYEHAPWFEAQVESARTRTWLVVGGLTAAMIGVLFLIVLRGSTTIAAQRAQLRERADEAAALAAQNEEFGIMADTARRDASEANERLLASIGSDIHDGPIQMLSLLVLKLTAEADLPLEPPGRVRDLVAPLQITNELLAELRNISAGLSLPEISDISLHDALKLAIARHEDLTGAKVTSAIGPLPLRTSLSLRICAYRVVQEGLTNSFKHAGSVPTRVEASATGRDLTITVTDAGTDRWVEQRVVGGHKLGIAGIRNRVSALKGKLEIGAVDGQGTQVRVTLPLTG